MRKHSECQAKDPATCRHHGRLSTTTKEDFMTSFITTNINKLVHLTDDEKLYLTSELKAIDAKSGSYHHDYSEEPAPVTREGEAEYLQTYDPWKYGTDPAGYSYTADNIIFTKGDDGRLKILLIERGNFPYKGYWCHPGGFIDEGETTHEAAVRELKEETSMDVSSDMVHFVKKYDHDWRDPRMKHIVMNTHVTFLPEIPKFEAADDAAAAKLVDVKSLYSDSGSLPLGFDHKQSIADSISYLLR